MKKVKRFFMMAMAVLACTAPAIAQEEEKVETTVAADVVNQYIWRGLDLGNVSLQPTLGVAYKGLSLTAWGSVGLESSDTKEFDLTLAYSIGGFHVGITDYWFNTGLDPENRYFRYDAHSTNHIFEANVGYDFGPLALQAYMNFAAFRHLRLDGRFRIRPHVHHFLWYQWFCRDQSFRESHERDTRHRQFCHSRFRTACGQSLFAEGLSCFWLYITALIYSSFVLLTN